MVKGSKSQKIKSTKSNSKRAIKKKGRSRAAPSVPRAMKTGSNFRKKIVDIINGKLASGHLTAKYIKVDLTAEINKLVKSEYGLTPKAFRKALTGPGHAEAYKECDTARENESKYSDPTGTRPLLLSKFLGKGIGLHSNYETFSEDPPFDVYTYINEGGESKKISFKPKYHHNCGKCWLCGLDVHAYGAMIRDPDDGYDYFCHTPCGRDWHLRL